MTSIFISSLNCPSCGEVSSFERYDRIDVSKTPQFRTSLIDWELFKFTCSHCGHQIIIDYPTLYVDEENKVIIQYLPSNCSDLGSVSSIKKVAVELDISKYKYRVVTNLEDFVEKVQIFSEGMDDKAIEFMKYLKSPNEDEDIMFSYEHMVFTKEGSVAYQFMFINQKEAVASLNISRELYLESLEEVAEAGDSEYVIDNGWAERFACQG
ncbi:CpXC domain-containing protein [Streptococcus sp. HF-1907]|uniref:CpXC domain-containing protein n=1 Tax=Streptococcus sp. HF-1907 TaxID=2785793 RepID=UPI00189F7073|nr:CpXC domain-containing protein [Streptococcus sp. HF-1907]MBF7095261.1 CpXC domain-containing protein [Streptococcus sp. HF-1907]